MKTIILYYSNHHGNTKKLVDAIQASDPENVEILDVTTAGPKDLSGYDLIGVASGIYAGNFGKPLLYNTFGPFKLIGGTAKGHPTKEELDAAVEFYKGL